MIRHVKTTLQLTTAALLLAATACASAPQAPQAPQRELLDNAPGGASSPDAPDEVKEEASAADEDGEDVYEDAAASGEDGDSSTSRVEPSPAPPEKSSDAAQPNAGPAPNSRGKSRSSSPVDAPAGTGASRGWGGALDGDTTSASSTAKRPMNMPAAESRDVCLQDCMDRNQKRAVDAQTIAADCQAECAEP